MDGASSGLRKASGLFEFPPVSAAGSPPLTVSADIRSSTKDDEIKRLREVVRIQGEFIMSLKHQIRDFLGNA